MARLTDPHGVSASTRIVAEEPGELWEALVHPGQKLKPGSRIVFDGAVPLHGVILERGCHLGASYSISF